VTLYRVEVREKHERRSSLNNITYSKIKLYFLRGRLDQAQVEKLCQIALADPVVADYTINSPYRPKDVTHTIDITFLAGVTDTTAQSLIELTDILNIKGLEQVAVGERILIYGEPDDLEGLANQVFSNPVIQQYRIDEAIHPPFAKVSGEDDTVEIIELMDATDDELLAISAERRLSLDLHEMRSIRSYYSEGGYEPTDAELEMLAQTWSEHCVHKTFRAVIDYTGPEHGKPADSAPVEQEIKGLLNTYIRAATKAVNKDWIRSAFVDNAGIVRFNDQYDLAFKAETHNRPSALEPFGGANTGVGGVIRDVLGVSARPIANTNILFFGEQDAKPEDLPEGVLHPQRIFEGVVAGVEDYGNKMGIPTVNGGIFYHHAYTSNPLVFCGCVGLLPHGSHASKANDGDLIVVIGGYTGRDGLRGATFSSMEMDTETSELSGGAVQIGHPIKEKQVLEVVLRARDERLYTAITDCGAGGLSSAVGEMGNEIGAEVQLKDIPLKYSGLRPWEIWLSEAQERMVLAVPPENLDRLDEICRGQDLEAIVIGTFKATSSLTLKYGEKIVANLRMAFLHDGIPTRFMKATWTPPTPQSVDDVQWMAHEQALLSLLGTHNIRSKEEVVRRYDHEVQGTTAIKPFVGIKNDAPSDAAVLVPQATQATDERAFALAVGYCPQYTDTDPYLMAWASIDEALRNVVAVGADPEHISILDNFSWGNTNLPDRLGSLVRASQGCYDAAVAYGVPFISGKDSLNNEYIGGDGKRHAIPGTLVISAMGIVPDVNKTATSDFKSAGNKVYLIGETKDELGGSHYHLVHGITGASNIPTPHEKAFDIFKALHRAIQAGYIQASHDLSEGGLAVALAEMCIGGRLGATVDLSGLGVNTQQDLYSESLTRFIVEVKPEHQADFEAVFAGLPLSAIGAVTSETQLTVEGALSLSVDELVSAWRGHVVENINPMTWAEPTHQPAKRQPQSAPKHTQAPKVAILHATGSNRDHDAAVACELAGGIPEIIHMNQLISGERNLLDYHMAVIPGGFSYGDDLGSGVIWALNLRERLGDSMTQFIHDGRPVLGICNGFQTLVKSGFLPESSWGKSAIRDVTLTNNAQRHFECRWVYLQPNPNSPSLFTQGLEELLYVPVAHGEGQVQAQDQATFDRLWDEGLIAVRYVDANGEIAGYPFNPNGSTLNIAGLTNTAGNVLGLMPHPENHVFGWQHPRKHRGENGMLGLALFQNGIKFA
jgi:phosphoribosylformylglycinamidine synthase II/phosphoribosylformylglycinamidine synthase I